MQRTQEIQADAFIKRGFGRIRLWKRSVKRLMIKPRVLKGD